MQIKKFNIPSFEEWNNNNRNYNGFIGGYFFRIEVTGGFGCKGNFKNSFKAYISDTDVSYPHVFSNELDCDENDFEKLKNWYNSVKEEANKVWEKYIIDTYFE